MSSHESIFAKYNESHMMMGLMFTTRLCFLGSVQFRSDDQIVNLKIAKMQALLAYLAVTRVHHTREHLLNLLWAESHPDAARKNMRNNLWRLRQMLGDQVLVADGERIALSSTVWTDVSAFESGLQTLLANGPPVDDQLQVIIDLWRGPLLDGLILAEAPDFEMWLTGERERLGQVYLRGLEALITKHRATGNWAEVIAVARRALAYDTLQEPMYRALMEAHARLGERPEALRQYDLLQVILGRELSVEPLPETDALRTAILSGELTLAEAPAVVAPSRPQPTGVRMPRPSQPFVGRQSEQAALDNDLRLAASGQTRVVLFCGELGIGKSRLWQEWSATLPVEMTVLETRCLNTTQSLPFAPLTGLFRKQACVERLFKPPSPVSPIWLAELARLFPEIREDWPKLTGPAVLPPEEERYRLFEALTQSLRALESQPLLLFIDDLHWVDRATLDWLDYLIDRMREEPLLLVGAFRPNDATAELIQLVAGWGRAGLARRLPLERLTREEAAELLAALGDDIKLAEQLHIKSAGNPYFLIELSRHGADSTPAGLAELVRNRLKQLPAAARQVLQAGAALETDFAFATLRRTSGRGEEETLDAVDMLLEATVLVEKDGKYEFTHPFVATIVQNDLSLARRSFLHRRAAEALEATYAGHLDSIAGRLSMHYAQAGRPALAAHYAELAAQHALRLAAPAEAAAFYRRAIALESTPARHMGLGNVLYIQGNLADARKAFGRAMDEFEAQGDYPESARARLALADSYLAAGQGDMVIHWAEPVLHNLDPQSDPEVAARAHLLLSAADLLIGRPLAKAENHLVQATRLATANDLSMMAARSQFALGNLLAERGDLAQAQQAFKQSVTLAQAAKDISLEVYGHNNLAYHALLAGDLDMARQHIETGLTLAEAHALFLLRQYLYSTRGEIALTDGRLNEAETWFTRALAEAQKHNNLIQAANIQANLGLVARERENLDQALMLLESARRVVANLTAPHLRTQIDLWLAELYLQRGERTAANEVLEQAEDRLEGNERKGLATWATRVRAALTR